MSAFKESDLLTAIDRMSMCKYFPTDPGTRSALMRELAKMCPSLEALEWLVNQMVTKVGEWRGPVELRGVLCWKFRPADGIEASCHTSAGFTEADGEALSFERHQQIKVGGYIGAEVDRRSDLKSLTAGDFDFLLKGVKPQ